MKPIAKDTLFFECVAKTSQLVDDLVLIIYSFCDDDDVYPLNYLVQEEQDKSASKDVIKTVGDTWILFQCSNTANVSAYNRQTKKWIQDQSCFDHVRRNGKEPIEMSSIPSPCWFVVSDCTFDGYAIVDLENQKFIPCTSSHTTCFIPCDMVRWVAWDKVSHYFYELVYDITKQRAFSRRLKVSGFDYCKYDSSSFLFTRIGKIVHYNIETEEQKLLMFIKTHDGKVQALAYLEDGCFAVLYSKKLVAYRDEIVWKQLDFYELFTALLPNEPNEPMMKMKATGHLIYVARGSRSFVVDLDSGTSHPGSGWYNVFLTEDRVVLFSKVSDMEETHSCLLHVSQLHH